MSHAWSVEWELFARLADMDDKIAREVAAGRCRHCGGPLHRGDYERKPRGGSIAIAGEALRRRYSLCCGRTGCRKRALPPSLRFLGRRVYLEVVVLVATVVAMITTTMREAWLATGVPARTLGRWRLWWANVFPKSSAWTVMRARFAPPPPEETELPRSLLDRIATERPGAGVSDVLEIAAQWLAPVTTGSVPDGSRFVRGVLAR